MKTLAFDSETALFRAGVRAPEAVCFTWQSPGEEPQIIHANDPLCYSLIRDWLENENLLLVGHNVAYDNAVICAKWPDLVPLVFKALDENRITDTKVRQQLLDIACGQFRGYLQPFSKEVVDKDTGVVSLSRGARWVVHNYDLDALTWRSTGKHLDKDTWRLRYGEFIDVPLHEWPEGARTYPREDARATLDVFEKQEVHKDPYLDDQFRQARAAWALHLTSVWGIRTYKAGVDALEAATLASLAEIEDGLKQAGLVRHDGSRDTKKAQARIVAAWAAQGKEVRLTDGGAPSLDSDACAASGDDLLEDYAELTALKAVVNKDIPMLHSGEVYPIHTSFNMAASGRVTSEKPAMQNLRRLPGIRESFRPREGKVYAQGDYSALELHSLAQANRLFFGFSKLGDVLNAGRDPHTEFACSILGIPYEEGVKRKKDATDTEFDNARQVGKSCNFGLSGGLGPDKMVLFSRKTYNVILTIQRAKELKAAWLEQWPEMRLYFKYIGDLQYTDEGTTTITQIYSNRVRSGVHFTAAANGFFQSCGADAAKRATYLVSRACYAEPDSLLYGSRIVNQIHDELLLEVDDDSRAHDKAEELARLMMVGGKEFMPDVPPRVEPQLTRVWSKKAKSVYGPDKRLIPWEPK